MLETDGGGESEECVIVGGSTPSMVSDEARWWGIGLGVEEGRGVAVGDGSTPPPPCSSWLIPVAKTVAVLLVSHRERRAWRGVGAL